MMSNITKCGACGAPVRFGHTEEDCDTIKSLREALTAAEYQVKVLNGANETLGRYYNEQKARAEKAERELAVSQARLKSLVATYERGE